jgi:hypothetical protein
MILESDVSWKEDIEQRLAGFEAAITKIADRLPCPELLELLKKPHEGMVSADFDNLPDGIDEPQSASASIDPLEQTWQVINDPEAGPAVIPSTVVSEVSPSIAALTSGVKDLISLRVIPDSVADECFTAYNNRLDHFVYRILDTARSLAMIRRSSPLLTAAICAVGALHVRPDYYPACYQEFMRLVASQTFSKRHTLDDIRGLILAAFWLYDISWTLIGAGE